MIFNMKKFLEALSLTLDLAEMDYFEVRSNHSRRVAYIAMMIGKKLNFNVEDLSDLFTLAIMHDNGVVLSNVKNIGKEYENMMDHCEEGEKNIKSLPMFKQRENVIKYHHENFDGTGFFSISGNDIPFFSQIIHLADSLDAVFDLTNISVEERNKIRIFLRKNENKLFNPELIVVALKIMEKERFWADMKFYNIDEVLDRIVPEIIYDYSWEKILEICRVFTRIIDGKSKFTHLHSKGVAAKVAKMGEVYNLDCEKIYKLRVAGKLHDLGKLYVPNRILDKVGKLDEFEFQEIRQHTYYTRLALDKIPGFEDIARWASNHHEKLNGTGYPESFSEEELDFESKLLGAVDIYQALTEERPYRKEMSHMEAMEIMKKMSAEGFIDGKIVEDIDKTFGLEKTE